MLLPGCVAMPTSSAASSTDADRRSAAGDAL